MNIRQQMRFESGFLKIEASGEFSLEEAKRTFLEMLGVVSQYHAEKVVFDGRNVNGKARDFERFLYGEFAAQETMRQEPQRGDSPQGKDRCLLRWFTLT